MKTYTFHVHVPGTGRVWRKIELVEDSNLEELHWAIQNAFAFGGDHLYSFFMSGKAWDRSSEYHLPEDALDWDEDDEADDEIDDDEDDFDDLEPEIDDETVQAIRDSMGDAPSPETFEEMLNLVSNNVELRGQVVKLVSEQTGMPAFMVDMLLKNANSMMSMMPEGMLDEFFADDDEPGDVRVTTLADLELVAGQHFMYFFDYGDEWRFDVKVDRIGAEAEAGVDYPRLVEAVGEAPLQYPDWEDEDGEYEDGEEWEG